MSKKNKNNDYEKEPKKRPIRKLFFSLLLIIVLTIIYARYIGTTGLFLREYKIINKNINELKIVHFSDFHYGRTTSLKNLQNLVNNINKTKPDIIFFTGDLIDKDTKINDEEMNNIIKNLKQLNSTYGNYYVNGEDDDSFDKYNYIMDTSNFININDNYDIIYNKKNESILITGLSTKNNTTFLEEVFKDEAFYNYKINIMHYPDLFDDISIYNYDLVLAGHSHNGQINIPFYGPINKYKNSKNYYKPYYKINDTYLYISSGIGTTDYSFRLFNRPSYNLYRLEKK